MKFEPKDRKTLTANQADLANKIAKRILLAQIKIASFLNKRTEHYTKFQKEVLLIIISLLFSGVSVYLLIKSIY